MLQFNKLTNKEYETMNNSIQQYITDHDLDKHQWVKPDNYYGFNPVGDIIMYSKVRDSHIIDESNFECIEHELNQLGISNYTFKAGCSMVGTIEYLMVKLEGLTESQVDELYSIIGSIESYLIFNDTDYNEKLCAAIEKEWGRMSLRERVELAQWNNACIFSARHDYVPDYAYDALREYVESY